MKFSELDSKMRVYETAHDYCVLPGIWIVARLDGRSFTSLTKKICNFEAPYNPQFRDYMLETIEHLMNAKIKIIYASKYRTKILRSEETHQISNPNQ